MATNQYQEAWLANAAGRAVDPDGVAGLQCVDAPKDYVQHIFANTSWRDAWPGAGNAKDMDATFSNEYFDWIPNDQGNPNLIPQRGDIIIWDGTDPWGVNPYGHIAVVLEADTNGVTVVQQDGFMQVPMFVGRLGYWNVGTGHCSGWLRPRFDDAPAQPAPASPTGPATRTVTNDVAYPRIAPFSDAALAPGYEEGIAKGAPLAVLGYGKGEDPYGSGDDAWYRTRSGFYVWANAAGNDISGLEYFGDLTGMRPTPAPEPAKSNVRRVGVDGVIVRTAPDKNADKAGTPLMPGHDAEVLEWFEAAAPPYPERTRAWFRIGQGWVWAGAFESESTAGIPQTTNAPAAPKSYDFDLDIASFVREDGVVIKVEKRPAHITNLQLGQGPTLDATIVHQMGKPGTDTIDSTTSWFANPAANVSCFWSVQDRTCYQHVAMHDRAWHAAGGNDRFGMETDPRQTDETILTARGLLAAIEKKRQAKQTLGLHKNVPGSKTSCGDLITLERYAITDTSPEPTPDPTPEHDGDVLDDFFSWLEGQFRNRK